MFSTMLLALLPLSVHGLGLTSATPDFPLDSEINISSFKAGVATTEIPASSCPGWQPEQKPGPSVVAGSASTFGALGVVLEHHFKDNSSFLALPSTAETEASTRESASNSRDRDGAFAPRLFYQARRHDLDLHVRTISATIRAFAAIRFDGSVVTWGDQEYGGNSSAVREQLAGGVQSISASGGAFAAIKSDGSVVTWGQQEWGGDSSAVREQLAGGVQSISAANTAFAAIKTDGSVVTWGDQECGGNSSTVREKLAGGVQSISATSRPSPQSRQTAEVWPRGGIMTTGGIRLQ